MRKMVIFLVFGCRPTKQDKIVSRDKNPSLYTIGVWGFAGKETNRHVFLIVDLNGNREWCLLTSWPSVFPSTCTFFFICWTCASLQNSGSSKDWLLTRSKYVKNNCQIIWLFGRWISIILASKYKVLSTRHLDN